MTSSNMEHMKHIDAVVDSDTAVLRQKESTYQGSWKAAGGRSAWFMFRRNMDRLLSMMKKPPEVDGFSMVDLDDCIQQAWSEADKASGDCTMDVSIVQYLRDSYVSENIFAKIRENPLGQDGTVLACLRDLRRYAILIEAEMVGRGVLTPEERGGEWDRESKEQLLAPEKERKILERALGFGEGSLDLYTFCAQLMGVDRQVAKEEIIKLLYGGPNPETKVEHIEVKVIASPENGSQHASLVPWAVSTSWQYKQGYNANSTTRSMFDRWWHQQAPGVYVMETAVLVNDSLVPEEIGHLYIRSGNFWVALIERCPPDARDWFPRLRREVNSKEHDELPAWQNSMYAWNQSGNKWVIERQHEAWARD
jgi:hypothetical protein